MLEKGVESRPTLVHNVETLAQLALIVRFGAGWFRSRGTPAEPGTFLATVGGAVRAPGVIEVEHGTTVSAMLRMAGGSVEPIRAVLVGGFHGAWIGADDAMQLPVSRRALGPYGASPGAGALIALPRRTCGLVQTEEILGYLVGEAAGQCGPCRFGMPELACQFGDLVRGSSDPVAAQRLSDLTARLVGRGACSQPDGTVRLVRSALAVFADEVIRHRQGVCEASVPLNRAGL